MNSEEIKKLIAKLEAESEKVGKEIILTENLEYLKAVAEAYGGEDKIISFEEIAERMKNGKEEVRIKTGWSGFDEVIGGFRPQQLVVVSALTKSGKTSFLMDLTSRLPEYAPLWFPFEESAEELVRKFLERGQNPPKAYTPEVMKGDNVEWIEQRIVEGIAKFGCKIVVIDQLDFIIPYNTENRADRIGNVMRALKTLARKWNVTIFLICHLVKTKMDAEPTLEDLKGSSAIGQEADTVIILWREMRREKGSIVITDNVNVSVQANRRTGKTGNIKMKYENGSFIECDWKREKDPLDF